MLKTKKRTVYNKKLEKIEADLHRVSGAFETDVKTLKDVIWAEISIQKNTYLAIQPVDKILKEGFNEKTIKITERNPCSIRARVFL